MTAPLADAAPAPPKRVRPILAAGKLYFCFLATSVSLGLQTKLYHYLAFTKLAEM